MRQQAATIFDEFVPTAGTSLTSAELNSRLGANDQIAIHAVVDNVTGAGTVSVFVDHSGDGRNWVQRNDQRAAPTTGGDLVITTVTGGSYSLMWADPCYTPMLAASTTAASSGNGAPLLPFVRLRVVASAAVSAHVKLHVALRGPR